MKLGGSSPSFLARLALLWATLVAVILGLFGAVLWRGHRDDLRRRESDRLENAARDIALRLQGAARDVARDARYLARLPALLEYARHGEADESRRRLVEEDFRALLEGKPSYFQVRVIGQEDDARELVRLDHRGSQIEITPADRLQKKGDRDYVREARLLPPDGVYLSEINLNRDFGKVTEPHTPTLRAVAKIKADTSAFFGLVVINVDMRALLEELVQATPSGVVVRLANAKGDFLVHPDPAKRFASDLGLPASQDSFSGHLSKDDIQHREEFTLREDSGPRLSTALFLPAARWLESLRVARNRATWTTGMAALIAALAVTMFARGDLRRLEAARRSAEDASRAREEFLAVMSHEIRTPMNVVSGLLRTLERNQPAPHQEPILRSLKVAASNLMALLNDALDYSKLRVGKIDFTREVFSLANLLSDIEQTHRALAMQKGLRLEIQSDPTLPEFVSGDPIRLLQILGNLLSNAVKFTHAGLVRLETRPLVLDQVEFIVSDSGQGIPPEDLDRVFAPFERAGHALRAEGTGLGLSIARALAERQGGSLSVTSQLGVGTRFRLVLPLVSAPSTRGEEGKSLALDTLALSGLRVLHVEDVRSNQEVMEEHFHGSGAMLSHASTGEEALVLASGQLFDLVLLDMQLPDGDGLDLVPRLRRCLPKAPILVVTANASVNLRDACAAKGLAGVILKPIHPDQLLAEVAWCARPRTRVQWDGLQSLFAGDAAKVGRMSATLAEEFRGYRRDFEQALLRSDTEAIRRLRHKMTSALARLGLAELGQCLERLTSTPFSPKDAFAARRFMEEAEEDLRSHCPG